MARGSAALALVAALAAGALLVSGGSGADPRTPAALPGMPPPFLGTAVAGAGGLTAAIDAYGDVADLRPSPAGRPLIDNPAARQAAGTVPPGTGIVPRLVVPDGRRLPFWRADSVAQRYRPGTNVVVTTARFGRLRATVVYAATGARLACLTRLSRSLRSEGGRRPAGLLQLGGANRREGREGGDATRPADAQRRGGAAGALPSRPPRVALDAESAARAGDQRQAALGAKGVAPADRRPRIALDAESAALAARLRCDDAGARDAIRAAARADRRWLSASAPLGPGAPGWASRLYGRSLLTLRALTDRRSGAVAAGARDGWAYVWPRDAATAALAFAAAGHRGEARRVAGFLRRLDLGAAARFRGDGSPVPGREAQGDARGWVAVALRAAGLAAPLAGSPSGTGVPVAGPGWREHPDYQEKAPGDYLGNWLAAQVHGGASRRLTDHGPAGADKRPAAQVHGVAGRPAPAPAAETGRASALDDGARHPSGAVGGTARPPTTASPFTTPAGLVRVAGDPASGPDSAAAWAVRPFTQPRLFAAARRSLGHLLAAGGRFGVVPSADWPGTDPWTAPTAWSAWAFAALARADTRPAVSHADAQPTIAPADAGAALARADRRAALTLLADLRRAATPAGTLPERVDAGSGVPRSTTPLPWSHAFALLALRELWPAHR